MEPAFIDRIFIVYKATGLTKEDQHRDLEVLNILRVVDFLAEPKDGGYVVLKDDLTGDELTFYHVPRRVFGYLAFMSIPTRNTGKWDARVVNGEVRRSMSFALLVKRRNKSSFYSKGNVYVESPNVFRELYPNAPKVQIGL